MVHIPSQKSLSSAYQSLSKGLVSEPKLALWSQWSRFDPRLGEILVEIISKKWKLISPLILNEEIKTQPWPACMGVILDHSHAFFEPSNLFLKWSELVMSSVQPSDYQLYFIGLSKFGGEFARNDAELSVEIYTRWGFLAQDLMINKSKEKLGSLGKTILSIHARQNLITHVAKEKKYFNASDVYEAAAGSFSRRDIQRALRRRPDLRVSGRTKSMRYTLAKG